MGRVYITDFKELVTSSKHVSTEFIVYDDVGLTDEIYNGVETNSDYLYELRFNALKNGGYYFISQTTRVKLRFVYADGGKSDWFIAEPSIVCPITGQTTVFSPIPITAA